MKILIIGSEGFIGKHLVNYYNKQDYILNGCDVYDLPSQLYSYTKISRLSPDWEELFIKDVFDVCINAAGSSSVPYSMTHPFSDFESNSLDTIRILDCIRRYQPACRYLHISSAAVYGNPVKLPIEETDNTQPLSPYGWHKLIAEQLCKEYSIIYKLSIAIIRPFSVYGPGLRKQLFWDIFQKSGKKEAILELWGTGCETRDFIYIDDLIQAISLIVERGLMKGEIYNIASGKETCIKEAVLLLLQYLEKKGNIVFSQAIRVGDPLNWCADISKIKNIGFCPTISIEDGLKKTAQWLLTQTIN